MSAGTLSLAVRLALVAALANDPAFDDCNVTYQYDDVPKPGRRAAVWTNSSNFNQQASALRAGRNHRDEIGRFSLSVLVQRVNTVDVTAADATEVVGELAAWISDRKNNELDVLGLQTLVIDGDGSVMETHLDGRTFVQIDLPIRYTARLT